MRLSLGQLKKLQVVTVSGIKLGNIRNIIFETDGQTILQYEVRKCCFCGQKLLINRNQVVRFEEKKMIVEDCVVGMKKKEIGGPVIEVQETPAVTMDC